MKYKHRNATDYTCPNGCCEVEFTKHRRTTSVRINGDEYGSVVEVAKAYGFNKATLRWRFHSLMCLHRGLSSTQNTGPTLAEKAAATSAQQALCAQFLKLRL